MQSRNFLFLIFTLFGGLALLTSCSLEQGETTTKGGTSTGKLKTATVTLHVSGNPKEVNITSPADPNCKRSNDAGCVEVPKKDEALISFKLTPKSGWRFTEFKICVGGTKPTQPCELNKHQQKEFDASLSGGATLLNPNKFGVIDLKPLSPDLTKAFTAFDLFDQNWVEQDYYYSIKVCPTEPSKDDCIWTDPPIENGGRRRN